MNSLFADTDKHTFVFADIERMIKPRHNDDQEEQVQAEKLFPLLDEESVELINKWVNHAHFSILRNGNSAMLMTDLSIKFRQLWQQVRTRKRA